MSLFDFLKRKKEIDKAKVVKKPAKNEKKEEPKEILVEKNIVKPRKSGSFSYEIIKQPHISEKSTMLGEINQYTFKILGSGNKTEIKKAVEGIYQVDVLSVNIIKIPRKRRKIGRTQGFRKGYTKAVVKIKEGQKIEIL